jgi:hypothetical protein
MKRSDNGSNDLDHVSKLPRWVGIAGAIFLVILLKACASFAASGDFDARTQVPKMAKTQLQSAGSVGARHP